MTDFSWGEKIMQELLLDDSYRNRLKRMIEKVEQVIYEEELDVEGLKLSDLEEDK